MPRHESCDRVEHRKDKGVAILDYALGKPTEHGGWRGKWAAGCVLNALGARWFRHNRHNTRSCTIKG
jgi:hypothetical protein